MILGNTAPIPTGGRSFCIIILLMVFIESSLEEARVSGRIAGLWVLSEVTFFSSMWDALGEFMFSYRCFFRGLLWHCNSLLEPKQKRGERNKFKGRNAKGCMWSWFWIILIRGLSLSRKDSKETHETVANIAVRNVVIISFGPPNHETKITPQYPESPG